MSDPTKPKRLITCCGMTAAMGTPTAWVCPTCATRHDPPEDDGGPAEYVPLPPSGPVGTQSQVPDVRGLVPGL